MTAERTETRECAFFFFVFVRSRFIDVEGCVLVLSVSRETVLSTAIVCSCAGLCVAGIARTGGEGIVFGGIGGHGRCEGTFVKVNLVRGGYSISSC